MGFSLEGDINFADSSIPGFKWIKVAGLSVGDKIVVSSMSLPSGIIQHHDEVNHKYHAGNNKENNFSIHRALPSVLPDDPQINHQGQNTGGYIKMHKGHTFVSFVSDILANFMAIVKNATAEAAPVTNVNQGVLVVAPGVNTPTTNDANIIFAPSRKKSEIVSNSSLANIQNNVNREENFVKYFVNSDVVIDEITSIEYVGREQVYDIEVEGTHNFVAGHWIKGQGDPATYAVRRGRSSPHRVGGKVGRSLSPTSPSTFDLRPSTSFFGGIICHNTYISANVGIGTTNPQGLLQVGTAPSSGLIVQASGNVGIGTTDPGAYRLYVNGDTYIGGVTVTGGTLSFGGDLNMNSKRVYNIGTANTSFDTAGNLGIGTSSPGTAALAVLGGNVGIGTTGASSANLAINGTILVAGTSPAVESDGIIYLGRSTQADDDHAPSNGSEYLLWDDDYTQGNKTGWFYFSGPVSMTSLNVRNNNSITFGTTTAQTISYGDTAGTGGSGAFTFSKEIVTQSSSPAYITFSKSSGTQPSYALEFNPDTGPQQTLRLVKKPVGGSINPLFEFDTAGNFSVFDSAGSKKTVISTGTSFNTNVRNLLRNGSFESNKPAGWSVQTGTSSGTAPSGILQIVSDPSNLTAKFGNNYAKIIDSDATNLLALTYSIFSYLVDAGGDATQRNLGALGEADRLRGKNLTISLWAKCDTGTLTGSIGYSYLASASAPVKAKNISLTTSWQNFIWTFPTTVDNTGELKIRIYLIPVSVNNPDSSGVSQASPAVLGSATSSNVWAYFDGVTLVEGPLAIDYGPSPLTDTGAQVLYGNLAIGANYDPYSSDGSNYYNAPRLTFGEPDSYFGGGYGGWGGGTGEIRFMRWGSSSAGRFMFNRSLYLMSGYSGDFGAGIQIGDPSTGESAMLASTKSDMFIKGVLEIEGTRSGSPANSVIRQGNLGIGLTSPTVKLDVSGDIRATGTIYGNISSTTGSSSLSTLTVTGSTYLATTTGSVGIGTTDPQAKFSVGSTSQFQVSSTGALTAVGVNSGSGLLQGTGGLTLTGTTAINTTGTAASSIGNASGTFQLESSALDISTAGALTGVTGITTSGGYTQSGTSANTFTGTPTFSNATYSALFTGGNLGIGTTAPAQKLHVEGQCVTGDTELAIFAVQGSRLSRKSGIPPYAKQGA
ncbi:MAG: hypothetical protein HY974_03040, partial [Candidatus Kerfeldbacteria bacterium]|nr:hypothetical protein [Candidatus Kerfeldbacteria bacterium]